MLNKKQKGYLGESLVAEHFQSQGFLLIEKNYTIRGGELDLIMKNSNTRLFVEVKVIDGLDDFSDYISSKKLSAVKRTMNWFFQEQEQGDLEINLAVVCVQCNHIYHVYWYET